jgi:hypothetical protein
VTIAGDPLNHESTKPGRVRADEHMGRVSILLTQHVGDNWPVSVCAYVDPDAARDVAEWVRFETDGELTINKGTIDLNLGRVYYNGPSLRDEAHRIVSVSVMTDGDGCTVELAYRDDDGRVTAETTLTESEALTFADALDAAADRADEWEPRQTPVGSAEPKPLWKRLGRGVVTLGVPLGITYAVAAFVMPRVAENMRFSGEPLTPIDPMVLMGIVGLVAFVVWSIQYLPGMAGGVNR